MKPELKVGDRVSVVLDNGVKYRGTVKQLMPFGNLMLDLFRTGSPVVYPVVHPKQCRRLKPKRKAREIWIKETDLPGPNRSGYVCISDAELVGDKFIRFREVLPKKGGANV